ncbi:hypothetical protein [Sulfitobacter sp. JB4-11]|uniref:hypothetical protein n=1 Tax=Sulfitobacter rhodophyticola TaxID=3238304 RepID=UPI0035137409
MSQYKPTFEERLARIHQTSAITPRCAKKKPRYLMTGVERALSMQQRSPSGLYKALLDASRSVRSCLMSL